MLAGCAFCARRGDDLRSFTLRARRLARAHSHRVAALPCPLARPARDRATSVFRRLARSASALAHSAQRKRRGDPAASSPRSSPPRSSRGSRPRRTRQTDPGLRRSHVERSSLPQSEDESCSSSSARSPSSASSRSSPSSRSWAILSPGTQGGRSGWRSCGPRSPSSTATSPYQSLDDPNLVDGSAYVYSPLIALLTIPVHACFRATRARSCSRDPDRGRRRNALGRRRARLALLRPRLPLAAGPVGGPRREHLHPARARLLRSSGAFATGRPRVASALGVSIAAKQILWPLGLWMLVTNRLRAALWTAGAALVARSGLVGGDRVRRPSSVPVSPARAERALTSGATRCTRSRSTSAQDTRSPELSGCHSRWPCSRRRWS